jgi:hypothetical protein
VLRRAVRPEKVEVTGGWKNWCSVELGDVYSSADNTSCSDGMEKNDMDGACHTYGSERLA